MASGKYEVETPSGKYDFAWKIGLAIAIVLAVAGFIGAGKSDQERVPEKWEQICTAAPDSLDCLEERALHERRMRMLEAMQDADMID